jgi:enterochelin esterase family protein
VFSAGNANPQENFKDIAAKATAVDRQLDLLWMAAGHDDTALAGAKRMDEFLTAHQIRHSFKQTPGEHTWIIWRQYLSEFAPLVWTDKDQN